MQNTEATKEVFEQYDESLKNLAKIEAKEVGNRATRRRNKAIKERISGRPGTGYTKRAAQDAQNKRNWIKRIVLEMKDNEQVIDMVSTGALDAYL